MKIGQVLKKSWKLLWHQSVLWMFVVLAGSMTIRGIVLAFFPHVGESPELGTSIFQFLRDYFLWQYNLQDADIAVILLVALLSGVLELVRYYVQMVAAIAIIRGIVWHKEEKQISFQGLWKEAHQYIPRYLVYFVILKFSGLLVAGGAADLSQMLINGPELFFVILFCFAAVAIYLLQLDINFAIYFLLIDNEKPLPAMKKGWKFFWDHFGDYFALGIVFGLVMAIPLAIARLLNDMVGEELWFIPIAIAFNAVFMLFQEIVLTHAYIELSEADREEELQLPADGDDNLTPEHKEEILFNPTDELPSGE